MRVLGLWLLILMLATGCSAPKEPAVSTETEENTFAASEPGTGETAATEQGVAEETGEDPAIALTKTALAETDWVSIQMPEGRIDMPANEAFLEALSFDTWEPVSEEIESEEIIRLGVGNGEIVIRDGAAYLLTDHGMDWYRTPEEVQFNMMTYFGENYTMSARSMLFNDEYMFAEYYHDTIASLGNLESFDGKGPLLQEMVKYAWYRYTYENAEETVRELYNEESGDFVFTKAMALQEAKRYFDFNEAATDFSTMGLYDAEKEGFLFWYGGPDMAERSNFQNGWGYAFGGLKEIGNERYEVRLIDYADSSQMRINKTNVMVISFDAEGNIRFDRGYEEVPSYNLADAAPGLEQIEIIKEYEYMSGEFLGETGEAYYFIMDDGEWVSYFKLDKTTMEMTTVYAPELPDEELAYRVEQHGEEFFFYTNKHVRIADADWKLIETVTYPEAIVEGLETYWSYGGPVYFGEAMSDDRSMFAYVDQEGLKLVQTDSGETTLLVPREGDGDVTETIWCLNPRFADHDTKIVTARTRDWDSGFTVYDLKTKTSKTVAGYVMQENWLLAGDRGFFISTKMDVFYYDFKTGEIKALPVAESGPATYETNFVLCNQNYAAYFDESESGKTLTLLDLNTWSIAKTASIKDVDVSMMFLGRTGDIGVSYNFTYTDFGSAIMRNK
jgi:hypothetical protein